ncbi:MULTISPECIES: hypothetical protein [unclassified Nocardioides]|uniref:hypothetical protein n=1 Tax=unclassified Nocardioides TaxID=2615069 RepID=UPI0009F01C36|nr:MULTISPECIES: hypothetical protein [unclassified Nocardioides]GAW52558.1 uncharacterized protein PD653B2_4916 [Nocardioides sp. PD653-B2]GAW55603.1 uncharacterized protein PD653_3028 [Nocardioides sp. PD653]
MFTRARRVAHYFSPSQLADPDTEWSRLRLQILLGVTGLVVLALVVGGAWSVINMLTGRGSSDASAAGTSAAGSGRSAQDALADKALPTAPAEAAQPGGDLSTGKTGTLEVPPPMAVGDVGVASGFPHTPQGALGQLAAIDSTALSSASVPVAQDVISKWAAAGGPTPESWSGVQGVAALLGSAGLSSDAQNAITISVDPKMGFIKGTVGSDFVVPCVDYIITATLPGGQAQQVATADCQRMVWQSSGSGSSSGRWVIGPGKEPAPAASLWPGTQASFDAGYQWLEVPQS